MAHIGASITLIVAAIISAVLMVRARCAYLDTSIRSLHFLSLAFLVFTIKHVMVATDLFSSFLGHTLVELVSALFDLLAMALLAAPLLLRRSNA